jgi:hypothetical protein
MELYSDVLQREDDGSLDNLPAFELDARRADHPSEIVRQKLLGIYDIPGVIEKPNLMARRRQILPSDF